MVGSSNETPTKKRRSLTPRNTDDWLADCLKKTFQTGRLRRHTAFLLDHPRCLSLIGWWLTTANQYRLFQYDDWIDQTLENEVRQTLENKVRLTLENKLRLTLENEVRLTLEIEVFFRFHLTVENEVRGRHCRFVQCTFTDYFRVELSKIRFTGGVPIFSSVSSSRKSDSPNSRESVSPNSRK